MTSSARARIVNGISSPRIFAVLRLTMSSTFVDLLDRQILGPVTLQDSACIEARLTVRIGDTAAVTYQAASGSEFAKLINRRNSILNCQCRKHLRTMSEFKAAFAANDVANTIP